MGCSKSKEKEVHNPEDQQNPSSVPVKKLSNNSQYNSPFKKMKTKIQFIPPLVFDENGGRAHDQYVQKVNDGEGSSQFKFVSQKSGMSQEGSKKHKRQKKQYKFVKETIDDNENKHNCLEVEEDAKFDENGMTNFETQQNDDFTTQVIKIGKQQNNYQQRISIENNHFAEKNKENKVQRQQSRSYSKIDQSNSNKEVKKMGSSIQRRQKSSKMSISESKKIISHKSSLVKDKNDQIVDEKEENQQVVNSLSKASSQNFELKENQFFFQQANITKQQIEQDLKVEEIEDDQELIKQNKNNNQLNCDIETSNADILNQFQIKEVECDKKSDEQQQNNNKICQKNENENTNLENQNNLKNNHLIESNVIQNNLFSNEINVEDSQNKKHDYQQKISDQSTLSDKAIPQQNQQSNSLANSSEQNIIKNVNTIKSFNMIDEQQANNNDNPIIESQIPLLTNQQLSKCEQLPEFYVDKCPEPSSIGSFINDSSPINGSNNDNMIGCKDSSISFELTAQANNQEKNSSNNYLAVHKYNFKEPKHKFNDKDDSNQNKYKEASDIESKGFTFQSDESNSEQILVDISIKQNDSTDKQTQDQDQDQDQEEMKEDDIFQPIVNNQADQDNIANQIQEDAQREENQIDKQNKKQQDNNQPNNEQTQFESQINQKDECMQEQQTNQLLDIKKEIPDEITNLKNEDSSEIQLENKKDLDQNTEQEQSKDEEQQAVVRKKRFTIPQKKLTKMSQFYNHRKSISVSVDSLDNKNEKDQQIQSNTLQPGSSSLKNITDVQKSQQIENKNLKEVEFNQKSDNGSSKNSLNKQSTNRLSIFNEGKKQNDQLDTDKNLENQTQKKEENQSKSSKLLEDQVFKQILKKQFSQNKEQAQILSQGLLLDDCEKQNLEQKVMLGYEDQQIKSKSSFSNKEIKDDKLLKECDIQKFNQIDTMIDKQEIESISENLSQGELYQENVIDTKQQYQYNVNFNQNQEINNAQNQFTQENILYLCEKLEQLKLQQEVIINSEKIIFQQYDIPPIKKTRTFSPTFAESYNKSKENFIEDETILQNNEQNEYNSENTVNNKFQIKNYPIESLKKQTNCSLNQQSLQIEENTSIGQNKSQTSIRNFIKQEINNPQIIAKNSIKINLESENKTCLFSLLSVQEKQEKLKSNSLKQIDCNYLNNDKQKNQDLTSIQKINEQPISIEIPLQIQQSSSKITQQNNEKIQEKGVSISLPSKVISINIEQINSKYQNEISVSEQLFTDQEFPPSEESFTKNLSKFQRAKGLQWKRIIQFQEGVKKHKQIAIYGQQNQISVKDTVQGWIANCYFVASLTCIAQYPQLVKKLFNNIQGNQDQKNNNLQAVLEKQDGSLQNTKNSCYSVNMCIDGQWQTVLIDDNLPCRKNDSDPIFCKFSNDTKAYWTCLLEKAYAKFKGCYSNIEGGKNKNGSSDAVVDMTGAPSKHVPFKNSNKEEIWKMIHEGKQKGYLFTTMLKDEIEENQVDQLDQQQQQQYNSNASLDGQAKQNGLISNHAYSILETDEIDGIKILKLKNPWGKTEWNGKWSDQCTLTWTEKLKQRHQLEVANDGIFWMSFCDYFDNFCSLCISYVNVDYFYSSLAFENNQKSEKQVNVYTVQQLEKQVEGYFIIYQNREHLIEEYESNQYVNHLVKINEMSSDGKEIIKQVAQIYISTTKFAFTEIKFEPKKIYKIVLVTEKSSNIVLAFYTSDLIPLSNKYLEIDCSQEILIQQARLLAKKEKINPLYQVYWISFFCEQNHIVEIVNDTTDKIFQQNIKFILSNIEIDTQLKENEYNIIKVMPKSTIRYIFKKINPKQQVQIQYSKYDPEFLDL
ncbi:calpain family cysteine protease (macronuclear) [Tetrahymena thermophila SB210]|uniref:Calpain family cysteine protease n=1 Tax=Tetrahymena thermophila (strain SB210) TaxID=312017 RepID=Q22B94_TETTS|nr:calpain family cysteine protease [Tetrahymena thermophila SB210]EAR82559.2 calpain family cysteine protease [Tetrahymena thermophila SB210]|eukprot:XP_001030222.2 calpain family cysteine protease [Tetrahymena thermophila SB210]